MADALGSLGELMLHQGDASAARALYEERLAVCRELGDTGGIADALWGLGYVAQLQDDAPHATTLLEESLVRYRELGNKAGMSDALVGLGHVAYVQGDYQQAAARYEASLALRREQGDRRGSSDAFVLIAVLGGGIVFMLAGVGLLHRHPVANYLLWFFLIGPAGLVNTIAHFTFPSLNGTLYFPGLITVLLPTIAGTTLAWRILQDSRHTMTAQDSPLTGV